MVFAFKILKSSAFLLPRTYSQPAYSILPQQMNLKKYFQLKKFKYKRISRVDFSLLHNNNKIKNDFFENALKQNIYL